MALGGASAFVVEPQDARALAGGLGCGLQEEVFRWADWTACLDRSGIVRNVRWHALRHTCASSLVSGWWGRQWTLSEVCELLGHGSVTTTERYAHLADTVLKQAARETSPRLRVTHARPALSGASGKILNDSAGAGHESRTRDLRLGKPTLYQLS